MSSLPAGPKKGATTVFTLRLRILATELRTHGLSLTLYRGLCGLALVDEHKPRDISTRDLQNPALLVLWSRDDNYVCFMATVITHLFMFFQLETHRYVLTRRLSSH